MACIQMGALVAQMVSGGRFLSPFGVVFFNDFKCFFSWFRGGCLYCFLVVILCVFFIFSQTGIEEKKSLKKKGMSY